MTNRRRAILTGVSLSIGFLLSILLFYFKKGQFDQQSLFFLGTVMAYSILIVVGIGWYLQRNSKKKDGMM
ncbi:MAG: hypothetical protein JNL47_01595 [Bacteroidia bacterium]|nr:hypothetical protein [Bacteroidia bacterium]